MTKAELKELMDEYSIEDFQQVYAFIEFVSELLYGRKIETKERYPYATKTISRLESAEHTVFDLMEYVEGIINGDDDDN